MKLSPEILKATFDEYNKVAVEQNCPFGKKFFDNTPFIMEDEFYVAIVTPVVH